jgi:hypothetical protein
MHIGMERCAITIAKITSLKVGVMNRPIPDGRLLIEYTDGNVQVFQFSAIDHPDRGYSLQDSHICIKLETHKIEIPWTSIKQLMTYPNSDHYVNEYKKYQREHEHYWVQTEIYDYLGNRIGVPNNLHCSISKLGDMGCSAQMVEGEVIY